MEELARLVLIAGGVATALGAMGRLLLAVFRVAKNAEAAAAAPARLDALEPKVDKLTDEVATNTAQRARTTAALQRMGDEVSAIGDDFRGLTEIRADVADLARRQDDWEKVAGKFYEAVDQQLEDIRSAVCTSPPPDEDG